MLQAFTEMFIKLQLLVSAFLDTSSQRVSWSHAKSCCAADSHEDVHGKVLRILSSSGKESDRGCSIHDAIQQILLLLQSLKRKFKGRFRVTQINEAPDVAETHEDVQRKIPRNPRNRRQILTTLGNNSSQSFMTPSLYSLMLLRFFCVSNKEQRSANNHALNAIWPSPLKCFKINGHLLRLIRPCRTMRTPRQ